MIHTLLHYGSYAAAFYAAYVVVGMAVSGVFLWRILRQPQVRVVPAMLPAPAVPEELSSGLQ